MWSWLWVSFWVLARKFLLFQRPFSDELSTDAFDCLWQIAFHSRWGRRSLETSQLSHFHWFDRSWVKFGMRQKESYGSPQQLPGGHYPIWMYCEYILNTNMWCLMLHNVPICIKMHWNKKNLVFLQMQFFYGSVMHLMLFSKCCLFNSCSKHVNFNGFL